MSTLRRTAIHRALHRPNLFAGGEREPVLVTAILCGGVAVSALNLVATAIGIVVWLIAIAFLRMMAKSDPFMSKVYLRQLRYPALSPGALAPLPQGVAPCWRSNNSATRPRACPICSTGRR